MAKPNLKSQAKRKRELAKLDKRQAKDRKRALRRAEGSEPAAVVTAAAPPVPPAAPSKFSPSSTRSAGIVAAPPATPGAPLTLQEAAERWRTSKVTKAKTR